MLLYICQKTIKITLFKLWSKIIFWTYYAIVSKSEKHHLTSYNCGMRYETKRKILKTIDDVFLKCIALLVAYIKLCFIVVIIAYFIFKKPKTSDPQPKVSPRE